MVLGFAFLEHSLAMYSKITSKSWQPPALASFMQGLITSRLVGGSSKIVTKIWFLDIQTVTTSDS